MKRSDEKPQRGGHALQEALHLQQMARENAEPGSKRSGRRRRGKVIDLDRRIVVNKRRHRLFMTLLWIEGFIATVAIAVLVAYLLLEGDSLL